MFHAKTLNRFGENKGKSFQENKKCAENEKSNKKIFIQSVCMKSDYM